MHAAPTFSSLIKLRLHAENVHMSVVFNQVFYSMDSDKKILYNVFISKAISNIDINSIR